MNGDSIAQARQAISDILEQLRPEDYFNIIAFGSSHTSYFDCQVKADATNITRVRRLLRSLEANMGGTEMDQALQAVVRLPGPSILQDVLLITDGQIWDCDDLIDRMKQSRHRVFTVGVGSSVAEGFVRQLASETGGACELVVPNEAMREKIVRHFRRIYLPRTETAAICWPHVPLQEIPHKIGPVYDGDTVHGFAFFSEKPAGPISLAMTLADGQRICQTVNLERDSQPVPCDNPAGPLTRMARGQSLAGRNETAVTALAVRYQLISRHTNYLVVDARADDKKGEDLPGLRKVPQMLAAGWGGTGSLVRESSLYCDDVRFMRKMHIPDVRYSIAPSPEDEHRRIQLTTPESFVSQCNHIHTRWLNPCLEIKNFKDLQDCGLPDRIVAALQSIVDEFDQQPSEETIVAVFLITLFQSPVGRVFDRDTMRAIKKAKKTLGPNERLLTRMSAAFAHISKDDWGSEYPLIAEDDESDDAND